MDTENTNIDTKDKLEAKLVDDAFKELLDIYLASRHRKKVDIITKAYNFARQAHKGVRRLSGEPYILHPIAVARIAAEEIGLGSTSICAALLHDVVEDTDYTVEDIENMFGKKIAQIVDGLTKLSGGIFGEHASAQTENFKKLLITMSDDIRVILIKICDRLHNMRTLASQPANKQYKIAGETLYIYAPLANRLGLNKIKTELEDLSFRYEHPEEYASIQEKIASTQEQRDELFSQFTTPIKAELDKMGFEYEIKARVKSPYSIWNKMQSKHVSFDEIYDILAVRIIYTPKNKAEEINNCFQIYVAISQLYKSHPDRLRDWVNHPKANGYQALHVTLMSNQGRWIEVQIRSERMNDIAEQGFAAHWTYKDGTEITEEDGELNDWLRTIKEILDDPQPDAMDFLDVVKLNLFASEIFVFTPKGEIKTMPAGCTALDFAFQIYVAISQLYKSHPDRLRDWVNHPKANGYQALHVTLMSNQGRWIEVQIRSERMNDIAEQGFAAHWTYKDGTEITEEDGELNDWLRTIKEILDDPQPDAMDFLDVVKLNLFASEIFVFTPKGEIKTMPAGCTALDFAFQIHTFLGSHCIGAKVNHKLVPLSHKLQSGDQVEILTSMSQRIDPSWTNIVSTAKAKGKIQALLRREGREIQKQGETIK